MVLEAGPMAGTSGLRPDGRGKPPMAGTSGVRNGAAMPDENFTELAGDRVVLRRFRLDDVPEFVAYRSCAEVARFQSWDAPYPREEGERFTRQQLHEHPDTAGEWFQFAVALRPA